jgi:hypothetical protein
MMAPAIVEIKKDLNFQSDEAASFSISAYVISYPPSQIGCNANNPPRLLALV